MANPVFDTYKNSVIPHVKDMSKRASDMDMETMCAYP